MPPQRNTIGVPTINLRHNVKDLETRRALEQLSQETTRWLQRIAEGVDTATGLRGEPRFHAVVNAQDNRIKKVGIPQEDTDAQIAGLALGRAGFGSTYWDAKNMPIRNLPRDVAESQADASLTQEQIRALIAEELRKLSDTVIAEPFVTVVASALLTAERTLTGTARISITDGGANSTVTVDAVGAALSKADDTNVTLTLGGAPTTALVNAASLTLGWSGQLSVGRGGTGLASYTVGDLIYASGATTLTQLADVATGNAIISGGVGVAPSYGKVGLTTHVSGVLPAANGGTDNAAYAVGDLLYASGATALSRLADVATGQVLASGGVGVAPAYTANPTVATVNTTTGYNQGGTQVVGAQGAAVADASGGATIDAEARTAINTLLARLRTHGLIAT